MSYGKFDEKLKVEISSLENQYRILKDYLSGADYDLDQVRECLHALKDGLSRIWVLVSAYTLAKSGKAMNIPVGDIQNAIDSALILIEWRPADARAWVQTGLGLSHTKIEDIMALLSLLKTGI